MAKKSPAEKLKAQAEKSKRVEMEKSMDRQNADDLATVPFNKAAVELEKSSSAEADLANHSKFAKFKPQGEN